MILEGDDNTKFFHLLANGRYRKTRITQLEQEEGIIVGQRNLMEYIYGMIYRNFNFLNFGIITLAFLMGHFQGVIPHILFCYGAAKERELEYSEIFGCNKGHYPFKYLGIPMHHRNKWLFKLINEEGMWQPVRCLFKIGDGTQLLLLMPQVVPKNHPIWKIKIPLKIKIFMWSIDHLFTHAICWVIWLYRNDVLFNNAQVPTPMQTDYNNRFMVMFLFEPSIFDVLDSYMHIKPEC
ncbi:hypothetical protein ACJX0J_041565 [Zea mays]